MFFDSSLVTICGISKSKADPPTSTTNSISLKLLVGLTVFKALIAFVTKTFFFASLLTFFIFSRECSIFKGIKSPSFTITTLKIKLGLNCSSKNLTDPSSCLM